MTPEQPPSEQEGPPVPENLFGVQGLIKQRRDIEKGIAEHQKLMQDQIAACQGEIRRAMEDVKLINASLKVFLLRREGDTNALVPGVGTVYLTTVSETIKVEDPVAFASWCLDEGLTTADLSAGKKLAKKRIKREGGGEVADGCEFVPERKSVAFKPIQ